MKKALSIIIVCVMAIGVFLLPPDTKVQAVSARTKAMNSYKALLKGRSSKEKFAVVYIDNNSVPELVLDRQATGSRVSGFGDLYTYSGGKRVKVNNSINIIGNVFSYFKKTGGFKDDDSYQGAEVTGYYKLSGKKAVCKAYKKVIAEWTGQGGTYYYVNNKKVSKSKFNACVKSVTKGKKATKAKLYANTKKNRDKYLK